MPSGHKYVQYGGCSVVCLVYVWRFSRCLAGGCGPRPRIGLPKIVVGSVKLHDLNMIAMQAPGILAKLPTSKYAIGSVCKLRSACFLLLPFPESLGGLLAPDVARTFSETFCRRRCGGEFPNMAHFVG